MYLSTYCPHKGTVVPINRIYLYISTFSLWGRRKDCFWNGCLWPCQGNYAWVQYSPYRDQLCQPECYSNSISRNFLGQTSFIPSEDMAVCLMLIGNSKLQCLLRSPWELGEADRFLLRYSRKKSTKPTASSPWLIEQWNWISVGFGLGCVFSLPVLAINTQQLAL